MNSQGRQFGRNLCFIMKKKGISRAELSKKTGYSETDILRIIDARLFVKQSEKQELADSLGVPLESLTEENKKITLDQYGNMECRGMFSTDENRDKILDLFDAYCDIQEMLFEER